MTQNPANQDFSRFFKPGCVHRQLYTDPAIFELEMARIFGTAWIYIGHESQVKKPGDYFATQIGRHPVVICDVAVPRDVSPLVAVERPNATVLRGGILRIPLDQSIDIPGVNLRPGEIYGCLGETILLGFAGISDNFSYGPLSAEKVHQIRELSHMHGFAISENPA